MKRHIIYLLIIFLAALLLRLAFLGEKSVWLDEAYSVWSAERTVEQIWTTTTDNHPPLYYLLLKVWMIFGTDEPIIRLPSVFASMVGLALVYLLARRLLNKEAALITAALLAISPLDVWYAQEARMNIFVASAGLLIALGMVTMGWKGALMMIGGLALGLHIDYPIIPIWAVLSGIWLARWWEQSRSRRDLLTWLGASLVGCLLFMPLWSHLHHVISRMSNIFIFSNIREALSLPEFGLLLPIAGLLILLVASFMTARWAPAIFKHPRSGTLAIVIILAFILVNVLMPVPRLYSVKRLLVTGWPFAAILIGWLVSEKLPRPKPFIAALLGLSLVSALVSLLAVGKDDWRSATAYINSRAEHDDVVWLEPSAGRMPYSYYDAVIEPSFTVESVLENPGSDVWHIAERQPSRPIPGSSAEEWLDKNRVLLETIPLYRLEVRHYAAEG